MSDFEWKRQIWIDLKKFAKSISEALKEAEERGRRSENEGCAKLSDDFTAFYIKAQGEHHFIQFERLSQEIRARLEKK